MPVRPTLGARTRREQIGLVTEMGGLDHQRVALPVATRLPSKLAHRRPGLRVPVEGNNTYVVNVLLQNDHVIRSLEQVIVVVVSGGQRRHAAIPDAPVSEIELFVRISWRPSLPYRSQPLPFGRVSAALGFGGECWQSSVLGVQNQ